MRRTNRSLLAILMLASVLAIATPQPPAEAVSDGCNIGTPDGAYASQVSLSTGHARVWRLYQALDLEGDGSVGLDAKLRPEGAFATRTRGAVETIDKLIAAGLLDVGMAVPAKIGMVALGGRRDENGNTVVVLPVTLREGQLFLGPAPLIRISPVL